MNITRAFADYMVTNGYGTFGTDVFIGGAPLDAPDASWWLISAGGGVVSKNKTGEKVKNYTLSIFYRNIDAEDVYEQLQALEELINTGNCDQLTGYDTIEMEASVFPADQDIEAEDRTVGLLQAVITVYQN